MITPQIIKETRDNDIKPSSQIFYLWMVAKFGSKRLIMYSELEEYGRTRRTLYRYMADLEDAGMIERERNAGTKIKLL